MQQFKNLTLIGTSHVAVQSLQEVSEIILKVQPKVVALELDKARFTALMSDKKRKKITIKDIMAMGVKGFLFNWIGAWVEKKIGRMVGVKPGSEMKLGAKLAREIGARIALVDRDIRITIKRLFKQLTRKEKLRFVWDIIKGLFHPKRSREEFEKFDLRKVPSEKLISELLEKVKVRYPSVYKTLVTERNEHMAQNLYKLMNLNNTDKIVAIVGAGHEKEIISLIKKQGERK